MIRKYNEPDLEDLLSAWEAASEVAHPFLTPEFLASERDNIPNLYLPNAETWVYEDGGRVVGFIALIGNEVGAIFVHPSHQKTGVGRGLLMFALLMIRWFRPGPEHPGFRWKPSGHWLCKAQ